jgi:hypothetical protein
MSDLVGRGGALQEHWYISNYSKTTIEKSKKKVDIGNPKNTFSNIKKDQVS